jgi:hypothetical protein
VVVGSDEEEGVLRSLRERKGIEMRRACAREVAAEAVAIDPRRKTTGRGPHVSERGRRAG